MSLLPANKAEAESKHGNTTFPQRLSMNRIRTSSLAAVLLSSLAIPALAGTVVTAPANGAQVASPFTLTMAADTCGSRPAVVVGYSLDSSTATPLFLGQKMDGPVNAPSGPHTVHVKVWNDQGAVCVTDVAVSVGGDVFSSIVPSNAVSVSSIQTLTNWAAIHDGGTPGSSTGAMSMANAPSLTGSARRFATSFSYFGGQRYSTQFDDNTTSQNFLYDTWVYIEGSTAGVSNLEFDLNQTMPSGETVIMGFQCDSWLGTWDYTVNAGSPTQFNDTWLHSFAGCNVHNWAPNQWHHVQILTAHNDSGWVTYKSVWLDGARQDINQTVFSGFALGWAPAVVTNFQLDGATAGNTAATVYLDGLTVYRW